MTAEKEHPLFPVDEPTAKNALPTHPLEGPLADDGEVQSTDDGETQSADDGEVQSTDDGETQSADDGEVQSTDDGETQSADNGEVQSTDDGETQSADNGEMHYAGFTLDRFQAEAIRHLQNGRSVLVAAPTGTGKTIIADYVVNRAMTEGREVIYTAPIKALSNQKYRDYTRRYGKEAVGLVTGDLVIRQDAQIRIMTTEILRNILLQGSRSQNLSHVIVDEVHFLDDEERGTVWEELLIYLPSQVKIVALSATLPNIEEFAEWLERVRGEPVAVIKEETRAVPLRLLMGNREVGLLSPQRFEQEAQRATKAQGGTDNSSGRPESSPSPSQKGFSNSRGSDYGYARRGNDRRDARGQRRPFENRSAGRRKNKDFTRHTEMVRLVTPNHLPILYFVFSRRQTEKFARELSRITRNSLLKRSQQDEVKTILDAFETENPDVLTREHRQMYIRGIAFHHAGLHVSLKALVEEMYERKLIQVLYCTSTFALGINMPARTVLFDALRKFNGTTVAPLTVRQFMQKAGRAGRRGMDKVGYVVARMDFSDFKNDRKYIRQYQQGRHERIDSAFNLSFSSVVNLLNRYSQEEIRAILNKSFLNFRYQKQIERDRISARVLSRKIERAKQDNESGKRAVGKDTIKRWRKRANQLERQMGDQASLLWSKFLEKESFLKGAGYLEDDLSFNAGANALMHIQINEVLTTEMLLDGVFEEADEDELFGILTGLVQDLPRSVVLRARLRGRWAHFRDRIKRIKESEIVTRASELMGTPVTFSPELMPFGHMWAQGYSLSSLMLLVQSDIDVSGDLVGAFRRAKDLAGQIRSAYGENDLMAGRIADLNRKVSRDEVEVID